jgi:hypothetical protein
MKTILLILRVKSRAGKKGEPVQKVFGRARLTSAHSEVFTENIAGKILVLKKHVCVLFFHLRVGGRVDLQKETCPSAASCDDHVGDIIWDKENQTESCPPCGRNSFHDLDSRPGRTLAGCQYVRMPEEWQRANLPNCLQERKEKIGGRSSLCCRDTMAGQELGERGRLLRPEIQCTKAGN